MLGTLMQLMKFCKTLNYDTVIQKSHPRELKRFCPFKILNNFLKNELKYLNWRCWGWHLEWFVFLGHVNVIEH